MSFEDIKILGFDDVASTPDAQHKALFRMHLTLSAPPAREWAKLFDDEWERLVSKNKRQARIDGQAIVVPCLIEELELLLPVLNHAVSSANQRYRGSHDAEAAAEKKVRQQLRELKERLKFD